jgi:hypothetical protein
MSSAKEQKQKLDKRAAALRDNLRKRKALQKDKTAKKTKDS